MQLKVCQQRALEGHWERKGLFSGVPMLLAPMAQCPVGTSAEELLVHKPSKLLPESFAGTALGGSQNTTVRSSTVLWGNHRHPFSKEVCGSSLRGDLLSTLFLPSSAFLSLGDSTCSLHLWFLFLRAFFTPVLVNPLSLAKSSFH